MKTVEIIVQWSTKDFKVTNLSSHPILRVILDMVFDDGPISEIMPVGEVLQALVKLNLLRRHFLWKYVVSTCSIKDWKGAALVQKEIQIPRVDVIAENWFWKSNYIIKFNLIMRHYICHQHNIQESIIQGFPGDILVKELLLKLSLA